MVEHIVLFKFSEETTKENIDKFIVKNKKLQDVISGITDIQMRENFSQRSKGFDIGLTSRFDNRQSLEDFRVDPKHQEVLAYAKEIGLLDFIVVDFEID